ncbi:hypothetical protein R3P38DRAFT_2576236 [Favolaschia claudopus]|uniref:CxC5 like cysteine cluster associated with KDZ domain-containing protein n=1 Tax=Favolaschia claudopus TaxID=2862362 RepID=A0AAV9ZJD4_9AGAR
MSILAVDILKRLLAHESLAQSLQFAQVQRFLDFTRRVWPEILDRGAVPLALPLHIVAFLSAVLGLSPELVKLSWVAFKDIAEAYQKEPIELDLDDAFRLHGNDHHVGEFFFVSCLSPLLHPIYAGAEAINPPISHCHRPECCKQLLTDPSVVEARLYTLTRGVLPVYSRSLYCRSSCNLNL